MVAARFAAAALAVAVAGAFQSWRAPVGAYRNCARPSRRARALGAAPSSSDEAQQTLLLENFLTQRSVQTLLFLLRTGRDEVTANWVHRFLGHQGMEQFHGTRGLKVSWDEYVIRLLTADTEEIVVSLRKQSRRGLSPGNPYAPKDQWFNYTVDIFPRDLGERVLTLRSALAREWIEDLATVEASQEEFLRAYRDSARTGEDPLAGQVLPAALEGFDAAIGVGDSTAYRGGNYDLLLRLSAQQGILRTLRALDARNTKQARYSADYLRAFYADHGAKFDGDGPNGVSRAFFTKLIEDTPRVKSQGEGAPPLLLDPPALAEAAMAEQRAVVATWRDAILPNVDAANAEARRRALEASFS